MNQQSDNIDHLYFGHLLNSNAKSYSTSSNTQFSKRVNDSTKDFVTKNFNKTNLGFRASDDEKGVEGLSQYSLRALDLLSQSSAGKD